MIAALPAFKPISSSYKPAQFAAKPFRMMNGAVTDRLYGKHSSEHPFSLVYLLIGAQAAQIVSAWYAANGDADPITVPSEAFCALTAAEQATIPAGLLWRFSAPPAVTRGGAPGWSRVTVELIGELA
jgi:hypothetical protein